jgi:hypothetical protein
MDANLQQRRGPSKTGPSSVLHAWGAGNPPDPGS